MKILNALQTPGRCALELLAVLSVIAVLAFLVPGDGGAGECGGDHGQRGLDAAGDLHR